MDRSDSNSSSENHTADPFTNPNPEKHGARQTAAKAVALPLAAVGGAFAEIARKTNELHYKSSVLMICIRASSIEEKSNGKFESQGITKESLHDRLCNLYQTTDPLGALRNVLK
ncbi:hypothetical protein BGZ76_003891 [Entomortierella beljakovae]|nr:hypothetical protein BGZ76_003891 [Entomortierella beljakovae]